jgi:ABC-type nickel/cobalt efflux system permease component RcnA
MFFAVLFLLAFLLIVVCFWRELAPCVAWAALQYHACPEMLACLHGESTPAEDSTAVDAAARADELHIGQLPHEPAEQAAAVTQPALQEAHEHQHEHEHGNGHELAHDAEAESALIGYAITSQA